MKTESIGNLLRLLLFSIFLWSLPFSSGAATVEVAISGGFDKVDSFSEDGLEYISLSQLADILGGSLDWEIIGHQIKYETDSVRFDFVIGSPFFRGRDSVFNMTYPALYRKGQLYVHPATFLPFLDRVTPQKISWNRDRKTIRVDSEYFNVNDISFGSKANGLLIEIFLSQTLAYDIFVTEGNWLNVSIRDGLINRARIGSRKNSRYMYRLRTHQVGTTGQISIRLKRSVEKWTHKLVMDPPRIQISIADPSFQLAPSDTAPQFGPDNKIDVIVIDPGHGGTDYGAIGSAGTREKDVALKIAKELAKLIRSDKQFKVIMTRDRDKTVSLEERARVANNAGADLFISIHANASPKRQIRGWNVFFLAPARNDSARSVEQLENSYFIREGADAFSAHIGSDGGQDDPILNIINEMIMTEFQTESYDFAQMIDREFRKSLKIPARGIDQAGFFVLNKVFTPSVLIESAFISNRQEERLLKDRKYQKRMAKSIYRAIKRFKAKYENL